MADVCLALTPAAIGAAVFFGVKAIILIAVSVATCVVAEAAWQKLHKEPVTVTDLSAVVTGLLLAFNVPSTTPVWALMLADIFAIIVVKQMFGGIGSNVLNPALMGRLFLMVVYPSSIMKYAEPMQADVMSAATPLAAMKHGADAGYTLVEAFIGKIPGVLGETSTLLLLIGFAYLVWKKEVNYEVTAAYFVTALVVITVLGGNPLMHFCSGGMVLGGCFMLTDYNMSNKKGNILYGVVAGVLVAVIRMWSTFPEGVCFSILMTNTMAVLIDQIITKHVYGVN
ncbi:MAG: RnfABCDGE type electron transport complex subunit D [Erysipelotrichaceae bacterium]|nr:RnfABCDGE type electron transport complex subunit D [Erysipelotrichaceae bacterium]